MTSPHQSRQCWCPASTTGGRGHPTPRGRHRSPPSAGVCTRARRSACRTGSSQSDRAVLDLPPVLEQCGAVGQVVVAVGLHLIQEGPVVRRVPEPIPSTAGTRPEMPPASPGDAGAGCGRQSRRWRWIPLRSSGTRARLSRGQPVVARVVPPWSPSSHCRRLAEEGPRETEEASVAAASRGGRGRGGSSRWGRIHSGALVACVQRLLPVPHRHMRIHVARDRASPPPVTIAMEGVEGLGFFNVSGSPPAPPASRSGSA